MKTFLRSFLTDLQSPRKKAFDLAMTVLIVASVAIFVYLIREREVGHFHAWLELFEWVCFGIFVVEYAGRFYVATDFLEDIRERYRAARGGTLSRAARALAAAVGRKVRWMLRPLHIIDLLALWPATRLFRLARLFRLLRLLRLVRYQSSFASVATVFRDHAYELGTVLVLILVVLVFAGTAMYLVENAHDHPGSKFVTLEDAYWWAIVSMTTVGYGDYYPITQAGRVIASVVILCGVCTIAIPTAIITSAFIDKLSRLKEGKLKMENISGHIVICGVTKTTDPLVRQIRTNAQKMGTTAEIAVVASFGQKDGIPPDVLLIRGEFTRESVLRSAGIPAANAVIVLAERRVPDTPDESVDARTIVTCLAVEALNKEVHIVAEILDPENTPTLLSHMPRVDAIETGALGPRLMATGALARAVSPVLTELLTPGGENDFFEVEVSAKAAGLTPTFGGMFETLRKQRAIAVGVRRGRLVVTNPPDTYSFAAGDAVLVIAAQKPSL